METLADVVARDRRSEDRALWVPSAGREYTYHDLLTTAYKAGNFLRYCGVRDGGVVGVADDPLPEPLLSFLGASLLGAVPRFAPPDSLDDEVDALVVPEGTEADYDVPPGCTRVAYGDPAEDPRVEYFERGVWSENPSFPPREYDPAATVLTDGTATWSHTDLLDGARAIVDAGEVAAGDDVVLRASLADPRAVAAVLAPFVVGAALVFPADDVVGDVGVGPDVPEARQVGLDVVDF